MVVRNGGKLVLFRMPMHSLFAPAFHSPLRQEDVQRLETVRSEWGVEELYPVFPTTDRDFPDYWHLRRSAAAEFSSRLADAWLEAQKLEHVASASSHYHTPEP